MHILPININIIAFIITLPRFNKFEPRLYFTMFHVGHLHKTQLTIPNCYLKDLQDYRFILNWLKKQVQNRCNEEFGYLIQVLPMKDCQKQKGIKVSAIQATEQGCQVYVQFDCLCFKRTHKGDIIDIYVEALNSDMIRGKVGPAEVLIPKQRMHGIQYSQRHNAYISEQYEERWMISMGSSLRCRCIQWHAQNDAYMKIIAEVDSNLVSSRYQKRQ